jgi:hypothetical protein
MTRTTKFGGVLGVSMADSFTIDDAVDVLCLLSPLAAQSRRLGATDTVSEIVDVLRRRSL